MHFQCLWDIAGLGPFKQGCKVGPKIKGGLQPTWGCPRLDPAKQVAL